MKTKYTIAFTRLICFIFACGVGMSHAEPNVNVDVSDEIEYVPEYIIEIVVFEDTSDRYIDAEEYNKSQIEELIQSTPASENDLPENSVVNIAPSSSELILGGSVKKLNSTGRFKVLVHKSWVQAGLDAETAINIPIDSTANNSSITDLIGTDGLNQNTSSVVGNIKVVLGRYLHVYTDLIYKRFVPNQNALLVAENNFKEYTIKTHRKMRSKQLHYMDHPLVGILVQATPVEIVRHENGVAE